MQRFPDAIDVEVVSSEPYLPDINTDPGMPLTRYEPPSTPRQPPRAAPSYDSGTRGLSDADIADFGTDASGRPLVDRDHRGRARWNPEIDLPPDAADAAKDAFDDVADNRRARRGVRSLPGIGDFLEFTDFTGDIADAISEPVGTAFGKWLNQFVTHPDQTGKPNGSIDRVTEEPYESARCTHIYRFRIEWHSSNSGFIQATILEEPGPIWGFAFEPYTKGGSPRLRHMIVYGPNRERLEIGNSTTNLEGFKPRLVWATVEQFTGSCGYIGGPSTREPRTPTKPDDVTYTPPNTDPPSRPNQDQDRDTPPGTTFYPPRQPPEPPQLPPFFDDIDGPRRDRNIDGPPTYTDPPPEQDPPPPPDLPPDSDNDPDTPQRPPRSDSGCCPATENSIDKVKKKLEEIYELVNGSGSGGFDLTPCTVVEGEEPTGGIFNEYNGKGIQGLFEAFESVSEAITLLHENTKCAPLIPQQITATQESEEDSWPVTVPTLLTQTNEAETDLNNEAQAFAWLVRNLDAISGQYPIELEIQDTDPITKGDQSETFTLPNQAEAMAELFGLAYEANTNSELAVNMLFRLIPEVIAAKNSSMSTQDYSMAMVNWLGFRTKNVERKVDSNFNPLSPESLGEFLSPSEYKIQGVEDVDPHTLVEWIQQIKYATAIVKASVFRGTGQGDQLASEMESVVDNQGDDGSDAWEKFIDALNRAESNLTDRDVSPRPRATSINDPLDPGTILPDPDPGEA